MVCFWLYCDPHRVWSGLGAFLNISYSEVMGGQQRGIREATGVDSNGTSATNDQLAACVDGRAREREMRREAERGGAVRERLTDQCGYISVVVRSAANSGKGRARAGCGSGSEPPSRAARTALGISMWPPDGCGDAESQQIPSPSPR